MRFLFGHFFLVLICYFFALLCGDRENAESDNCDFEFNSSKTANYEHELKIDMAPKCE